MTKFHKNDNFKLLTAKNAVFIENIPDVKGKEEVILLSRSTFIITDILPN